MDPTPLGHVPCSNGGTGTLPPDAGAGVRYLELCVGLSTLSGEATLDGLPTTAPVALTLRSNSAESVGEAHPGATGAYALRVLSAQYDHLLYHPDALGPGHEGAVPQGPVDLRADAVKRLSAQSWILEGVTTFDGSPWKSGTQAPDLTLTLEGLPAPQQIVTATASGAYRVRALDGQSQPRLSVTREALGDISLYRYKVDPGLSLTSNLTRDFHLPASTLEVALTLDGLPVPDRRPGDDLQLELGQQGETVPAVYSYHDVSKSSLLTARVPRGQFSLGLYLSPVVNPRYPAYLYDFQLAPNVDLTADRQLAFDLTTVAVEGTLSIAGQPVTPDPSQRWQLYAYGYGNPDRPGYVAIYDLPLESAGFNLRFLPSNLYYLLLYLTPALEPRLPNGWFMLETGKAILQDLSMAIEVPAVPLDGELFLEGASVPLEGTLHFSSQHGSFFREHRNGSTFSVLLPHGTYKIWFEPSAGSMPGYARGRYLLGTGFIVDGKQPQLAASFDIVTRAVGGALRVGAAPLGDTLAGKPEGRLTLQRLSDGSRFTFDYADGSSAHAFRAPAGEYTLSFELFRGALPETAAGRLTLPGNLSLPAP